MDQIFQPHKSQLGKQTPDRPETQARGENYVPQISYNHPKASAKSSIRLIRGSRQTSQQHQSLREDYRRVAHIHNGFQTSTKRIRRLFRLAARRGSRISRRPFRIPRDLQGMGRGAREGNRRIPGWPGRVGRDAMGWPAAAGGGSGGWE